MSSIQIKTIQGSGPYAYRVEYVGDGEQNWEYIGQAADIGPEIRNQLRDETTLPQLAVKADIDLQKRAIANEQRDLLVDRFGEYVLSPEDDRRRTNIKLSGDAPQGAVSVLEGQAEDLRNAAETIGQEPLTDAEKNKDAVDFSKRSVFWWRSAKADLTNEGISNWTDYVDPQIEDPHSQSDDLSREDRSGGKRLDEDRRGTDTTSQLEAMDRNEKRAVEAVATDDDDQARDYLLNEAGYDPAEIDAAASEVAA